MPTTQTHTIPARRGAAARVAAPRETILVLNSLISTTAF
jgi:hypothetical protein